MAELDNGRSWPAMQLGHLPILESPKDGMIPKSYPIVKNSGLYLHNSQFWALGNSLWGGIPLGESLLTAKGNTQ